MLWTKGNKLYSHLICSLQMQIDHCLKQYQFQQLTVPHNSLNPMVSVITQFQNIRSKGKKGKLYMYLSGPAYENTVKIKAILIII